MDDNKFVSSLWVATTMHPFAILSFPHWRNLSYDRKENNRRSTPRAVRTAPITRASHKSPSQPTMTVMAAQALALTSTIAFTTPSDKTPQRAVCQLASNV
jgi:hypothetical protein